ncbi:hypothetical protein [Zhongshania aquimaris]|uniref:Uncharacterized protein n=1 Tax=Zhongshania aquimaris TaxID=2857107 RepID=A0ABS6VMK0_9GAMM|nr:hypothetical protein [Zhongshania aquimaris]MBW2939526.1 hypothetical protein [Zhongshania aquimaris]
MFYDIAGVANTVSGLGLNVLFEVCGDGVRECACPAESTSYCGAPCLISDGGVVTVFSALRQR